MKKGILTIILFCFSALCLAQTQPMRFMGINMNSTITTFMSKLKGKGFVVDTQHSKPNMVVMKGMFAGERVKLEVHSAAKTHMVSTVNVLFNLGTQFTYADVQERLTSKYGKMVREVNKIKDEPVFIKYTTDYSLWHLNVDTLTNEHNAIILSKCGYQSNSPLTISYRDGKNSKVENNEINSDF